MDFRLLCINDSQTGKDVKVTYHCHETSCPPYVESSWSKSIQSNFFKLQLLYLYLKFGGVSWKFHILSVTALSAKQIILLHVWLSTAHHIAFWLNRFLGNIDFPSYLLTVKLHSDTEMCTNTPYIGLAVLEVCAPQLKNAVCALQINCKLPPFPLEKSCWNEQTINSLS